MIQRRRAELLGRTIRACQRRVVSAVPDPHDDTVVPPLWLRTAKSPISQLELALVTVLVVVIPVGWVGGWVLKHVVTRLIPGQLRAFPVAALLWSGAGLGLVTALIYDPNATTGAVVLAPWLCVQVAAIPAVAGVYGIAEGWLAVPGSTQWWPLTPTTPPLTDEDADAILGGYDLTRPGPLDAGTLGRPGERPHA